MIKIFRVEKDENYAIYCLFGRKVFKRFRYLHLLKKLIAGTSVPSYLNYFVNIKNLPPAVGAFRKVQEVNVILLNEFKRLCEKHGISYWLDSGTLLGAVRHQGHIPWDDDVDVAVLRTDYPKLLHAILEDGKWSLREDIYISEQGIPTCVRRFGFPNEKNLPVLDVFLFDKCSFDNREAFRANYTKLRMKLSNFLLRLGVQRNISLEALPQETASSIRNIIKYTVASYATTNEGDYVVYGIESPCYNIQRGIFEWGTIFPLKTAVFEGSSYPVPQDTETYLTINYGNYMSLPSILPAKHRSYLAEDILKLQSIIDSYHG